MKRKIWLLLLIATILSIQFSAAQQREIYTFDKKISLPGAGGYDYLSVDTVNNRLYVSHGTSVNVIDLKSETPIGTIDSMKGIHGIAIVNEVNKGFISDGRGDAVIVFDLKSLKKIATIPVNKKGADAIMYDPFSKKVLVFCGASNSACVIDVNTLKEDIYYRIRRRT